jgi:hypothetical protein
VLPGFTCKIHIGIATLVIRLAAIIFVACRFITCTLLTKHKVLPRIARDRISRRINCIATLGICLAAQILIACCLILWTRSIKHEVIPTIACDKTSCIAARGNCLAAHIRSACRYIPNTLRTRVEVLPIIARDTAFCIAAVGICLATPTINARWIFSISAIQGGGLVLPRITRKLHIGVAALVMDLAAQVCIACRCIPWTLHTKHEVVIGTARDSITCIPANGIYLAAHILGAHRSISAAVHECLRVSSSVTLILETTAGSTAV